MTRCWRLNSLRAFLLFFGPIYADYQFPANSCGINLSFLSAKILVIIFFKRRQII